MDSIASEPIKWPTNSDDMLPYASEEDYYWTGYYSSRATLKSLVRYGSESLHASNFMFA
jgi:hypothetical protein